MVGVGVSVGVRKMFPPLVSAFPVVGIWVKKGGAETDFEGPIVAGMEMENPDGGVARFSILSSAAERTRQELASDRKRYLNSILG